MLGDPEDLWNAVSSVSVEDWQAKRREYSLHRFPVGHSRVWTISNRIVGQYNGDTRNIWQGQSIESTLNRVLSIGAGEQISRMIVGALTDTSQVIGKGDVKADVHICRVLGRALRGDALATREATEMTRKMHPSNPWVLDRPLFAIGRQNKICTASNPKCQLCYLQPVCAYYARTKTQRDR